MAAVLAWTLILSGAIQLTCCGPRPFYLFAHMVNDLAEVDEALLTGTNAIEADISFAPSGEPLMTYHEFFPADCFRLCCRSTPFPQYLDYIRRIGTPGDVKFVPSLVLFYLDLKLSDVLLPNLNKAGALLADAVLQHFFQLGNSTTRIRLIMGFQTLQQIPALDAFLDRFSSRFPQLLNNIGFDISFPEDDDRLLAVYETYASRTGGKFWIGDGAINCLTPFRSSSRLLQFLQLRDVHKKTYFSKSYAWTVDYSPTVRHLLRFPIDGMMTNDVVNVQRILAEPEFSGRFRLATSDESPWQQFLEPQQ